MTKLTAQQVFDKLLEIRPELREILVWTADHGVEPDKFDSARVINITREIREDLLDIRRRCVDGFEEREEKYSKITDEGKAVEKRR